MRPLIGNAGRLLRHEAAGDAVLRSGAGGHISGHDVVRVTVKVLAGPVVAHRGAWIGVAGGDLDVPQVHACVKTGRERFTNRVEYLSSQDDRCGSLPSSLPL